jgi:hypothetical protein
VVDEPYDDVERDREEKDRDHWASELPQEAAQDGNARYLQ